MARYRPESRSEIKRKVKDFGYKAKDRAKHMSNAVKDSEVISDVSKNIRSAGTIEAAEEIKQHLLQLIKDIKRVIKLEQRKLKDSEKEAKQVLKELKQRSKDSKYDLKELVKSSRDIRETYVAKNEMSQAQRAAEKDLDMLLAGRDEMMRLIRKLRKDIYDSSYDLKKIDGIIVPRTNIPDIFLSKREVKKVIEIHKKESKRENR